MINKMSFIDESQLSKIRQLTSWQSVFVALGFKRDEKKSKPEDWWCRSPFSDDKTASMHINANGWYCFSTQQGGGVIELVQAVHNLDCYQAGKWILEHCSSTVPSPITDKSICNTAKASTERINQAIEINLVPHLETNHPMLGQRGISQKTCDELGIGYLAKSRSKLSQRIVFQIRGIPLKDDSTLILSHLGRATLPEQAKKQGKWYHYSGFHKSLELYNQDYLWSNKEAIQQAQETGHVVLVEGCFDVAKLHEAGIKNALGLFGAGISDEQILKFKNITSKIGVSNAMFFTDRDEAGEAGFQMAVERLKIAGVASKRFNWDYPLTSTGKVISRKINDPCDMNIEQLRWLRLQGLI